jgi:hypothetical protein
MKIRPTARSSRTGSDGPRRTGLRRADDVARDVLGRRVDELREAGLLEERPDERVLGRGRVGVRVATGAG